MRLIIKEFKDGKEIPLKFTCDGKDETPEIEVKDVPENAASLALIVDDPDAPSGLFTHWMIYDLDKDTKKIDGKTPGIPGVLQGVNDFGNAGYGGPCPPPGKAHHYYFTIYALNTKIGKASLKRKELDREMNGHVIEKATYLGTYKRNKN